MRSIFISYRREETHPDVLHLRERLGHRYGKRRVFTDSDIPPAADFTHVIFEKLAECDVFIALIGDRWLAVSDSTGRRRLEDPHDWVRTEILTALRKGICIIPCLVRGAKPLRSEDLPAELADLANRQTLRISYEDVDADIARLLEIIDQAFRNARRVRFKARLAWFRSWLGEVPKGVNRHRRQLLLLLGSGAAALATGTWLVPKLRGPTLPVFADDMLAKERPSSVYAFSLPDRGNYFPSPLEWRDEVIYYILPDRFSDAREDRRPKLDRSNLASARPAFKDGSWSWQLWSESAPRWQGGTLKGVQSKLDYLQRLGISTIWLGPIFKQRVEADTYHGFAIQDFLEVDPHFGTRRDLAELVSAAHERNMRVIITIVFNHSGTNWIYPDEIGPIAPRYTRGSYPFGRWLGGDGKPINKIEGPDDAVWPVELQNPNMYVRAGYGMLGGGDFDDPEAEHKRSDFGQLRKFRLSAALNVLVTCYKYWIALTDCDGFHFDTLQLVSLEEARSFCDQLKSYATQLGKSNFFLAAELIGSDFNQDKYLEILSRNLHANLDAIVDNGLIRLALNDVARGRAPARKYFREFDSQTPMGRHRSQEVRRIAVIDDLDNVFGEKVRFATDSKSDHQAVTAVAFLLFSLGIPCLYYGTEQGFAAPEQEFRRLLANWGIADYYLREALFGPDHPRKPGRAGLASGGAGSDDGLPGFGAFGTSGHHCFDERNPTYLRIAALTNIRRLYPALRSGNQDLRPIRTSGEFRFPEAGELVAWSRTLGTEEILCIVNTDASGPRSADVTANSSLEADKALTVVANTMEAAARSYSGPHPLGSQLRVMGENKRRYVELRNIGPCEVVVIASNPLQQHTEFDKIADNYRISPYVGASGSGYSGRRGSR